MSPSRSLQQERRALLLYLCNLCFRHSYALTPSFPPDVVPSRQILSSLKSADNTKSEIAWEIFLCLCPTGPIPCKQTGPHINLLSECLTWVRDGEGIRTAQRLLTCSLQRHHLPMPKLTRIRTFPDLSHLSLYLTDKEMRQDGHLSCHRAKIWQAKCQSSQKLLQFGKK